MAIVDKVKRSFVYTYDAVGNRLTESLTTHAAQTTFRNRTFTYNPATQLTQVSENGQVKGVFGYDDAGNAVTLTEGGITHRYVYDHRQQMLRAVNEPANGPPTIAGEYEYDFAKRRIGRNGIRSVYDGDELIHEFSIGPDGTPVVLNQYTQGAELIHTTKAGNAFADAQGSVTLTDDGTTAKRTEYGAFGEVRATDNAESAIGYTGQFYDLETDLQPLGNGEQYLTEIKQVR